MYYVLPLTEDPRQVFTMDLTIDGDPFHARVEIRYLPAPVCWVVSIWDDSSGDLLINQIPLICSYGEVNDLLRPFRYIRDGWEQIHLIQVKMFLMAQHQLMAVQLLLWKNLV